jgi:tetratricopeptide (TPR) repeat protein
VLTLPAKEILEAVAIAHQLEALRSFEKARDFAEKALLSFPKDSQLRHTFALSCCNLGLIRSQLIPSAGAIALVEKGLTVLEELARVDPGSPSGDSELGTVLQEFGNVLVRRGQGNEAAAVFKRAVKHQQAALAKDTKNGTYRQLLNGHLQSLAEVQRQLGRPAEAAAAAGQRAELWPDDLARLFSVALELARCIPLVGKAGDKTAFAEQAERDEYARQAIQTLRRAIACGYKDGDRLRKDPELELLRRYQDFEQLIRQLGR